MNRVGFATWVSVPYCPLTNVYKLSAASLTGILSVNRSEYMTGCTADAEDGSGPGRRKYSTMVDRDAMTSLNLLVEQYFYIDASEGFGCLATVNYVM